MQTAFRRRVRGCVRRGAAALTVCGAVFAGTGFAPPASAGLTSDSSFSLSATTVETSRSSIFIAATAAKRQTTRTTIRASRAIIDAGQSVKLHGTTVYGTRKTRVRSQILRLQIRRGGEWTTVGTKWLSRDGQVTYTVRPSRSTTYRLLYLEHGLLAASASPTTLIRVRANTSPATIAKVLAVAAAQTGKWYRWGAAGPAYFDCSGLTLYVYRAVGLILPHRANAQKAYGRAVSRGAARPGDLVVFLSGGYGYHVGIYAGHGYIYDAPYPGQRVGKHRIWSANVMFRRLL